MSLRATVSKGGTFTCHDFCSRQDCEYDRNGRYTNLVHGFLVRGSDGRIGGRFNPRLVLSLTFGIIRLTTPMIFDMSTLLTSCMMRSEGTDSTIEAMRSKSTLAIILGRKSGSFAKVSMTLVICSGVSCPAKVNRS